MNTSMKFKYSRRGRRHRQWLVWRILLASILLVSLVGAAIVPMSVQAAEIRIAEETRDSVSDASSITQEEPIVEEPAGEKSAAAEVPAIEESAPEEVREPATEKTAAEETAAEKTDVEEVPAEEKTDAGKATVEEPVAEKNDAEKAAAEVSEADAQADESQERAVSTLPDASSIVERVYSVDPFDAEYSGGYFCIKDSVGHGTTIEENDWLFGTNTERSEDIYIDHHEGACISGVFYDIREYLWVDNGRYAIDQEGANRNSYLHIEDAIHREFHFYEAGTLDTAHPVEVTFRGILQLDDNDAGEGYAFDQGLVGIWLSDPTHITRRDAVTWIGTRNNNNDGVDWERETIWAEVEGTPETPLILTYVIPSGRDSGVNFHGNKITYHISAEGNHGLPDGVVSPLTLECVTYAHYSLITGRAYRYYSFDGWYWDVARTDRVPADVMVSKDLDFYGVYSRIAGRIDTEVVGGTITDTVDYIEFGKDMTITYAPNEGYILDTVTVDGKKVDPAQYPDTYVFRNIQDDHAIKVVYVQAKAPVKSVSKGGVNVDREVLTSGDEVRYSIAVQNPTSQPQDIVVYDEVDERLRICAVEDGGEADGQAIAWLLEDVPAGSSVTVHFRAAVIGQSTEQEIGNVAYMHMSGYDVLPSNEVKVVVAPVPTPTTDVIHKTREETETIRTINYETVTKVVEVPQVAVPTVAQVEPATEPVMETAAPVVAEEPVVSAVIATGDDSLMWLYLAAAGAAALTLAAWFVRNARQMR